jgi:hypothetical protein
MSILPHFLRSLFLTILLSFVAPILLVTLLFAVICAIAYIPGLETTGQVAMTQLLNFLAVFGTGSPLQGATIIGLTCSLVGGLFDTYAYYRFKT